MRFGRRSLLREGACPRTGERGLLYNGGMSQELPKCEAEKSIELILLKNKTEFENLPFRKEKEFTELGFSEPESGPPTYAIEDCHKRTVGIVAACTVEKARGREESKYLWRRYAVVYVAPCFRGKGIGPMSRDLIEEKQPGDWIGIAGCKSDGARMLESLDYSPSLRNGEHEQIAGFNDDQIVFTKIDHGDDS